MHALTSPVFRSIALGGVLLATTLGAMALAPATHRLVLHAPVLEDAYYLTAWRAGDVEIPVGYESHTLTFRTRATMNDGCRWQATETLVPLNATRYSYRYDERLLSCEPGAEPYVKTPRVGYVDVVD